MSEPEPYPTPGPAPYELPNDKSQAVNKKKLALRYVLDTVEKAVRELEADFAETGDKSPAESITDGLGGSGSAWKSTLADQMRTDFSGVISDICSCISSEEGKVRSEWNSEPQFVDKTDPRAEWGKR